jgi:hypothetical protein
MNRSSGLNAVNGEARAVIGGQSRKLCVAFGALAEIETELGVSDMAVLAARLKQLSPQDLWVVVSALLRGAGESDAALVNHAEAGVAQLASAMAAAWLAGSAAICGVGAGAIRRSGACR